ncbi:hypothetical protein BBJ29_007337 [Phytophthora kernoviae]|uniref:Uncharacterized protein n=1 Tax=Phytophthora kernoviae TaxID=325452 RepID=A0A421G2V4_9STRA|nr:hypothetical protein BBJ29_007337 [Phytophthora kernoviae]
MFYITRSFEALQGQPYHVWAPQIRSIWEDFHADKDDAVATTLLADEFQSIVKRATAAPYFIFPVYRQEGFFNMQCQLQQSCFFVMYLVFKYCCSLY